MTQLINILKNKGYEVTRVSMETPVAECIRLMKELNIGSVLVMDADKVAGIFTERVAVRSIYLNLKQLDLEKAPVKEVMDTDVIFVSPEATLEEAMMLFTIKRTRHLPVIQADKVIGLVSIGDVTKWIMEQQQTEIEHLSDYISGDAR